MKDTTKKLTISEQIAQIRERKQTESVENVKTESVNLNDYSIKDLKNDSIIPQFESVATIQECKNMTEKVFNGLKEIKNQPINSLAKSEKITYLRNVLIMKFKNSENPKIIKWLDFMSETLIKERNNLPIDFL